MKRHYEKPELIIELLQLNQGIAACETPVDMDPETCDFGFEPQANSRMKARAAAEPINPFYDETNCNCYYTAPSGTGYFGRS